MINIKTVYFAHPKLHYDTDFEWECIETILTMLTPMGEDITKGHIQITNPNQQWIQLLYKNRKDSGDEDPFELFREMVRAHDIIVGTTCFDGVICAGVANEMKEGLENGKDVYLIYVHDRVKLFLPVTNMDNYKILSIEETRERIKKEIM